MQAVNKNTYFISKRLSSLPYITVALYIFYGFPKVKLCKITSFKHNTITSAYFKIL